ncbi:hypothetical protein ELI_0703 [Eubacterium callanderi]|uniref:Uncharacterized protein n=1 Tax=Eubacterium callanderi TaxID=53442 RepID=E3GJ82_9FIRM|nr:hypothetical protein ELI_0703 [Eubacterium callanderi]
MVKMDSFLHNIIVQKAMDCTGNLRKNKAENLLQPRKAFI